MKLENPRIIAISLQYCMCKFIFSCSFWLGNSLDSKCKVLQRFCRTWFFWGLIGLILLLQIAPVVPRDCTTGDLWTWLRGGNSVGLLDTILLHPVPLGFSYIFAVNLIVSCECCDLLCRKYAHHTSSLKSGLDRLSVYVFRKWRHTYLRHVRLIFKIFF